MKNRIPRSAIRAACAFAIVALIAIVLIAIAPISFSPPFGTWTRLSADPIVSPQGDKFQSFRRKAGWEVCVALQSPGSQRHILSWLRRQRRRRAFHPTARTGPDFRGTLRKGWRSGRPQVAENRRHVLPDIH